ncbi:PepSY domain-containing protein [Chitinophaga eiseniae]|nr:PepSY-associated TM helix domain-containing protein [Chitinophaga eiseniae]
MDIKTAKRWFNWHKWSSLICTLFLLMLCVTGLPLIFHEELDKILEKQVVADAHALIYSINLLNR